MTNLDPKRTIYRYDMYDLTGSDMDGLIISRETRLVP